MSTVQVILVVLIGIPIVGSIVLLGAVMGGRAAMRSSIEAGRVYPQCPHPACPYRNLGQMPQQNLPRENAPHREG